MVQKWGFLAFGLVFSLVSTVVAQDRDHQELGSRHSSAGLHLTDQLGFQVEFYREIIPNKNSNLSIHLEDGVLELKESKSKAARRIYQGRRDVPNAELDLLATDAGKARTFIAAVRACEKLVPLGQWKLASVEHIMAFFGDLLPGYPLFQDRRQKGFLFWASSSGPEADKKNKEMFYTTPELGGEKIELQYFTQFTNYLREQIAKAPSKEEKEYYVNFLKETREGIPVICIIGKEP